MQFSSSKKTVVMALSAIGTLSILPFAIMRFIHAEWLIGIVDLLIAAAMALTCFYIIKTKRTQLPSAILAVISCVGVLISIYVKGLPQVYWLYPAMIAAYYLLSPLRAVKINLLSLFILSILLYPQLGSSHVNSILITLLMTNLFAYIFSSNVEKQHRLLSEVATRDALTKTGNRRALNSELAKLIAAHQRSPHTVSLILFDLDHFKAINDQHGHIVGDKILQESARIIQERMRATDSLYRYGGEEFVIVPIDINLDLAKELAEQLRLLIENHQFNNEIKLTISFGVAEYNTGETYDSWLSRADKALYQAKQQGRNQVCVAD